MYRECIISYGAARERLGASVRDEKEKKIIHKSRKKKNLTRVVSELVEKSTVAEQVFNFSCVIFLYLFRRL